MDAASKKGGKVKCGEVKRDRKSGTGVSGEPKKGGHGGKFTWEGGARLEVEGMEGGAIDAKDPNFQDDDYEEEKEKESARGEGKA